ncbi:hypothetical protein [Synechococcus sp. HK01-R]|uniref:hypothetical protein n=1 Tax=Synechococcus sp. HK01-R TaxID=2751171 RepID=UPI001627B88F|nr:hypothetical protein [Synechococcus sp. HK01-R]QNG26082.1 hypothetical protein H0O21_07120 [Synechococcus sp. HK01-R]
MSVAVIGWCPAVPGRGGGGGGPELERQGCCLAAGCRVWLAFCGWGWAAAAGPGSIAYRPP